MFALLSHGNPSPANCSSLFQISSNFSTFGQPGLQSWTGLIWPPGLSLPMPALAECELPFFFFFPNLVILSACRGNTKLNSYTYTGKSKFLIKRSVFCFCLQFFFCLFTYCWFYSHNHNPHKQDNMSWYELFFSSTTIKKHNYSML